MTTSIIVGDTRGFNTNDFIRIGEKKPFRLLILPSESKFVVNRLANTGVHTTGISSISLLPTEFRFGMDGIRKQILSNDLYFFDSKSFIGFGTQINNYTLPDGKNLPIPPGGIYIPNHKFQTGQELRYHVGYGGTGIYAGGQALLDGSTVYASKFWYEFSFNWRKRNCAYCN